MTIGFDASRAFVKNRTGTENYSYQLLRALTEIDQKNNYIVYVRIGFSSKEEWPSNFHFSILNFQFLWTQIGLGLQTFKDHLNVLFVPAHTLPVIHKPGLKTVVTVHDLGLEYLPAMHQLKQRFYLGLMQRYQLKNADKLIAVSKATNEDLVKKIGVDSRKVSVVYEGYNKQVFKPGISDIEVNSLKPYYLFVGTVQPRKNLERIIKAFAQIVRGPAGSPLPLTLLIVGREGWLSDDIYELPKLLGIENRVKFLGHVPDEKLPALYSGAEALVFPSLFEGFGLPILEAQACGCPVITSNISSMPEVAGKGALLVDPYSVESIENGMVKLMDKMERKALIALGKENIKRFSWEKSAKETLKVLESV